MSTLFLTTVRSLPRAAAVVSNPTRSILRFNSSSIFPKSPIPPNPLGNGAQIKTVAVLSVGGINSNKIVDRNSLYFARYCVNHGITLRRVEYIENDEGQIIEASRRMIQDYDLVVAIGGTGPRDNDITYASIAKAFELPLEVHAETLSRLNAATTMSSQRDAPAEPRGVRERMAMLPAQTEVLFVGDQLWMPVVRVKGKLCIIPGIPNIFKRILGGLSPYLYLPERVPPSQ